MMICLHNQEKYAAEIEEGKRSVEDKRMANLYSRLISEGKENTALRKKKDDDFILKFLFSQIDAVKTGVVSAQEIFASLSENKDAVVFFNLCTRTLFADLEKYKTIRKGLFTIHEFSEFVLR